MQKLKGLWIPVEVLLNKDLSDKEKIILSMILYLSEETKSCFASNKYIANMVNVTANSCLLYTSTDGILYFEDKRNNLLIRQIVPIAKDVELVRSTQKIAASQYVLVDKDTSHFLSLIHI